MPSERPRRHRPDPPEGREDRRLRKGPGDLRALDGRLTGRDRGEAGAAADYDGRRFRATANSRTGQVSGDTLFEYRQDGGLVWANYAGGGIRRGHLLGTVASDGGLDFRYHHVDAGGELRTGTCRTRLEILPDGRYRLHERWQWTDGDRSTGTSVLEEVAR